MTTTQKQNLEISWVDGYITGFSAARRNRSSIAQSIRNAAINWPQYLGDVECSVVSAFCYWSEWESAIIYKEASDDELIQARTFMLLAAEALE